MRLVLRRRRGGRSPERGGVVAEEDGDAVEPRADPHDLAGGAQAVELRGLVSGDASRQYLGLPERDRQRHALQRHERLAQRRAPVDPVPRGQEARQCLLLDRLDFLAQRSERSSPQPP